MRPFAYLGVAGLSSMTLPVARDRSAAHTTRCEEMLSSGPEVTSERSPVATAAMNASMSAASAPPCPSAAEASPSGSRSMVSTVSVRNSWTCRLRPSPSMLPSVPKIRVLRKSSAVNAVIVKATVTPPSYSRLTTW